MTENTFPRWVLLACVLAISGVAAVGAQVFWASTAPDRGNPATVVAFRGLIEQEIWERGLVRPARVVPIQSEIMSNQARVIWLVEEGAQVNKGLVVARFDTKPFMDALLRAEQDLVDAQGRLEAALKAVDIHHEEAGAQIESTERNLKIARLKADDSRHGTGVLERERLVQALERGQRAAALASLELDDFEMLLERGHVSRRERDTVADKLRSAEEDRTMAERQLANFDRFEWPRKLREADVIIEAAETELARVRRVSAMELRRLQSELVRHSRAVDQAESKLDSAKQDVADCDVRSPVDGVLLYRELGRADGRRKIRIGDDVWMGQAFMEIPDTSGLVVEATVREVDVAKLAVGMPAEIRLDALPDRTFAGELEAIDPVAEADEDNPFVRRFRARIRLAETKAGMHPGMSADVRIVYRRVEDALVLPVAALTHSTDGPLVRLREGGNRVRELPVRVGAVGSEWVEIIAGLRDGDVVEIGRH